MVLIVRHLRDLGRSLHEHVKAMHTLFLQLQLAGQVVMVSMRRAGGLVGHGGRCNRGVVAARGAARRFSGVVLDAASRRMMVVGRAGQVRGLARCCAGVHGLVWVCCLSVTFPLAWLSMVARAWSRAVIIGVRWAVTNIWCWGPCCWLAGGLTVEDRASEKK
jgi:hypothetical protein